MAQWANKCHLVMRRTVFKSYMDLTQEEADKHLKGLFFLGMFHCSKVLFRNNVSSVELRKY